jgi:uncharacterized alpha-E superfamily protein
MLSRTADHLYWMARYIERAENLARVLDVTYRMSLVPNTAQSEAEYWQPPMQIAGDLDDFAARYGEFSSSSILHYLVLDEGNPSSIVSSLGSARENARAVRVAMASEMWESVNSLWLELGQRVKSGLQESELSEFCDWVKSRSHLFRGVTFGTKLRDDGFRFLRLGTMIERADSTARLIDVKYHLLHPGTEQADDVVDYYEWSAVLRSVSAFEAYQKVFRDTITPRRVAELLVLRHDMPRSLHACFDEITPILEELTGARDEECMRLAGELHARLHYGRMDDIFRNGLHPFLADFKVSNNNLGIEIQGTFF